jgi:hypothetical protein
MAALNSKHTHTHSVAKDTMDSKNGLYIWPFIVPTFRGNLLQAWLLQAVVAGLLNSAISPEDALFTHVGSSKLSISSALDLDSLFFCVHSHGRSGGMLIETVCTSSRWASFILTTWIDLRFPRASADLKGVSPASSCLLNQACKPDCHTIIGSNQQIWASQVLSTITWNTKKQEQICVRYYAPNKKGF